MRLENFIILFTSFSFLPKIACGQVVFDQQKPNVEFDFTENEKNGARNDITVSFQSVIHIIDPSSVNNYISTYIYNKTKNSTVLNFGGSSSFDVAGSINLSIVLLQLHSFRLRIPIEYGGASTSVTINTQTENFKISRFSSGIMSYLYTTHNGGFIGAGLILSSLSFNSTATVSLGERLEFGATFYRPKTNWDIFMLVDFITGKVDSNSPNEIDFSGPGVGLRVTLL